MRGYIYIYIHTYVMVASNTAHLILLDVIELNSSGRSWGAGSLRSRGPAFAGQTPQGLLHFSVLTGQEMCSFS